MPYTSIEDFLGIITRVGATRDDRHHRGGIIPYLTTEVAGFPQTFYCLGLDYSSGNITDFAGKREYQRDRDIIDTSLREFQEETLRVFGNLTREDLIRRRSTVIYDHQSVAILVPFTNLDMLRIADNYLRSTRSLRKEPELSMLIWLNDHQLRTAITENKRDPTVFYYPTGRLLCQVFSDEEREQCGYSE